MAGHVVEAAPEPFPLGQVLEVRHGTTVTRPDSSRATVTGAQYVLDVVGVHALGERQVIANPAPAQEA